VIPFATLGIEAPTQGIPWKANFGLRQVTLSVRFGSVTLAVPAHKAKYLKMDTLVGKAQSRLPQPMSCQSMSKPSSSPRFLSDETPALPPSHRHRALTDH
jgi:hypothetical protein